MTGSPGNSFRQGRENGAGVGDRISPEVELLQHPKFRQVGRPFENTRLEGRDKALCSPVVSGTATTLAGELLNPWCLSLLILKMEMTVPSSRS